MSNNTKYWKGEEELVRSASFVKTQKHEFSDALPLDEILTEKGVELNSNRRDFLKFFGFSVTSVALAACYRTPIRNAVPYLVKPNEVTPGIPLYYNSSMDSGEFAAVEVKVREGRPIKLDGNKLSPIFGGGLSAAGQASILDLYDSERLQNPLNKGKELTNWNSIDATIAKKLNEINVAGKKITLVTKTINSPSALRAINKFKEKFTTTEHVVFDNVNYSAIITANQNDFGQAVIPTLDFAAANVIVSFGADFLCSWISPTEYAGAYAKNRVPKKGAVMSQHFQFESNLSMTGTNADIRIPMKSSKEALYLSTLYNEIVKLKGGTQIPVVKNGELAANSIAKAAKALVSAGSKTLVVSGSDLVECQQLVNAINVSLGNIGTTVKFDVVSYQYKGTNAALNAAKSTIDKDGAIIFWEANPVYSDSQSFWENAIKSTSLSISFSRNLDETAEFCNFVLPDHHYLESWGDVEPKSGHIQFMQPTISPVFNTRQAALNLLIWAEAIVTNSVDPFVKKGHLSQKHTTSPYYSFVKETWATAPKSFEELLHDGYLATGSISASTAAYSGNPINLAPFIEANSKTTGIDLVLYNSNGVGDGSQANNPWLQELPDPVSKVTWDNYVSLPKALAEKLGYSKDDTITLEVNGITLKNIPALVQPGQANETIGLAIGYGRWAAGKVGGSKKQDFEVLGVNAYPFISKTGNKIISNVNVTLGDDSYELAQTQTHHSIEGRNIIRETTYGEWQKKPNAGNDEERTHIYTLWEKADYAKEGSINHRWGLAIDLNACNGCGSCIVSCHIENNVPVVGRDEVRLRREMHWLRIDRYYAFANNNKEVSSSNYLTEEKVIAKADKTQSEGGKYEHWENINVVHQPMMCQHCAQAPCESVCPVLATTHSSEGLNQMTYNRCIGTKYCGNNCPYKVRRFNWFRYNENDAFDFHFNNPLGKMVMNPDVTVRTRGVMEKCSMCVQNIQAAKLKAKRENRLLNDGDAVTACQKSCHTGAIVFGDLNDSNSEISKLVRNERTYGVLEELNVQSSVSYFTKVRNID